MDESAPPCVASVVFGKAGGVKAVGLAIVRRRQRESVTDQAHSAVIAYQFMDGHHLSTLESILVGESVTELAYCKTGVAQADATKLEAICSACSCFLDDRRKSLFSTSGIRPKLQQLFGDTVLQTHDDLITKKPLALSAIASAIGAFGLLDGDGMQAEGGEAAEAAAAADGSAAGEGASGAAGSFALVAGQLVGALRLDTAAVKALNLLPETASAPATSSLLGLLSQGCRTAGGRKVLRRWMLQPLTDVPSIERRQRIVGAIMGDARLQSELRRRLLIPDLDTMSARLQRQKGGLADLVRLYQAVQRLPGVSEALAGHEGSEVISKDLAGRVRWCHGEFGKLISLAEAVLDDPGSAGSDPRISPTFDPSLGELASAVESLEMEAGDLHANIASGWGGGLDIKAERDKQHGLVFRCPRKHDRAVRGEPGVVVHSVLKDGVRFSTTSPAGGLRRVAQELQACEEEYRHRQAATAQQVMGVVRTFAPVLEATSRVVSELDAYLGMAVMSTSGPAEFVRPTMLPLAAAAGEGDRRVLLEAARHPVLERQDAVAFIPNDYRLRAGAAAGGAAEGHFEIVTGPNMGGKSTYIRQLGCIAVLAQMGCFVPARSATLPVFDAVMARIGAGDAASKGVSTFMAEMLEAAAILQGATHNSLVIVDELGRGTSTYDGFGLAWAIGEHLAAQACSMTLFATHFHELASMEREVAGVVNRHVAAQVDDRNITMLYEVRPGPCPASFGIHVAEQVGFPEAVVGVARAKAMGSEQLAKAARANLDQRVAQS